MEESFEDILERLKYNEEVAVKFFAVEASILSIFNFKDFFEKLLTEIREKFSIPHVWLSLIDENEVAHMISEFDSSEVLRQRLNIIDKKSLLRLIGNNPKVLLVNEDLGFYYKIFPQNEKYLIRSLAIAPIMLDGEIIGSLNHGDSSPIRYCPGMDTTLLERLAIKVSICLSNVTAHEKIKFVASKDPLTGLLNGRVMEVVLGREFNRAIRYESPLTLILMGLDDLKWVNDRYGSDAGDALLKHLGAHLKRTSRESDVAARYDGDEFVVILPSTPGEEAEKFMERVRFFFDKHPVRFDGDSIPVRLSFGIADIQDPGVKDPSSLLKTADQRLQEAKKGKNRNDCVILLGSKQVNAGSEEV